MYNVSQTGSSTGIENTPPYGINLIVSEISDGAISFSDCGDTFPQINPTCGNTMLNNYFNIVDNIVSSPNVLSYTTSHSCAQIENHDLVNEVESSGSKVYFNEISNEINNFVDNNNNSDPDIEFNIEFNVDYNNVIRNTHTTISSSPNTTNVLENSSGQLYIEGPNITLSELKAKNSQRLIIVQININAVENKFQSLVSLIKDNIDIIMISETNIDSSFPLSQFKIDGYSSPFRLDRNSKGGSIMILFPDFFLPKE